MGEEETLRHVVRVKLGIRELVVQAVVPSPVVDGALIGAYIKRPLPEFSSIRKKRNGALAWYVL